MSIREDIDKIVKKAALDGTLTQEAAEQVLAAMRENEQLKEQHKSDEKRLSEQGVRINTQTERIGKLEIECETWAGREQDLLDRERRCEKLEVQKECADQRVLDHRQMVEMVFRNLEVRRNVFTAVPGLESDKNNYNRQTPYVSEDKQTEETR
jgi:hypothetical protein